MRTLGGQLLVCSTTFKSRSESRRRSLVYLSCEYDKVAFSTFGGFMTAVTFVLLVGVLLALFNYYVSQEL